MRKFIERINKIYKPFRKVLLVMFVFIGIAQALSLVSPYLYGKIIDAIIERRSMQYVVVLAFASLFAFMAHKVMMTYYRDTFQLKNISYDVFQHVVEITLKKALSLSVGQHANENSGLRENVIRKGEQSLVSLVGTTLYTILPLVLHVVLSVVALLYLSIALGLIVFFGVMVFVGITVWINIPFKAELKKLRDIDNRNGKLYTEIMRNAGIVKIHAQEKRAIKEYIHDFGEFSTCSKLAWIRYAFLSSLRNIIPGATRFLVVAVGAYYVHKGMYTPGYLVVFFTWSSGVFERLESVGKIQRECMELYSAIEKYFTFIDIEPAVQTVKNPVRLEPFAGKVEFKDVSFRYPTKHYLLDEGEEEKTESEQKKPVYSLSRVSFAIEPGQKVAFVGHSGAGKSTIARMLIRAYDPDGGRITIDGVDLRLIDLKHFLENVGVVEQDVTLFDQTLRRNICYGLNGKGEHISDQELDIVTKEACIDKFWHRLEDGYNTIVGERGVKLSGGERQRVGIARALIKKPQILIFDEATSHLDTENEASIRRAIEKASHGRTTIIIAHRLSTIKNVDKIFVMEKGRLVGQGTHKELMESCEAYKKLISSQITSI